MTAEPQHGLHMSVHDKVGATGCNNFDVYGVKVVEEKSKLISAEHVARQSHVTLDV
jgi:hypothetical protein